MKTPTTIYDPAVALRREWPTLIGYPLTVATTPFGKVIRLLSCGRPVTRGLLRDGTEVSVATADLVAVPLTLELLERDISEFVYQRMSSVTRGLLVFRVVGIEEGGIGASILAGGNGKPVRRASWDIGAVDDRIDGKALPWLSTLETMIGQPAALSHLQEGAFEHVPVPTAIAPYGGDLQSSVKSRPDSANRTQQT